MVLAEITVLEAVIVLSGFLLAFFGWLSRFRPVIFAGGIMIVFTGFGFFVNDIPILMGFIAMGFSVMSWGVMLSDK